MKKFIPLCILIAIFSCSKDKDRNPDDGGNGELVQIEYKSDAIVLDKNPDDVIVSMDKESQIYTLKGSAFPKGKPKVGETILVPGQMLRKVKSVRESGDNFVIETNDAAVTEVIENGSLSFDFTPEWTEATSLKMAGKEMLTGGRNLSSAIESEITIGGVTHKISVTPKMVNGKINACTFVFEMTKNGTKFTATGTATLPDQKSDIVIENGSLKTFKSQNNGIKADFRVEMATAGGDTGEHSFKLPSVVLSIPIRVIPSPAGPIPNPIPMSIDVGLHFVSKMTIPDPMSSATGKTTVSFDANTGFEFKNTTVEAIGGFVNNSIPDGVFDAAANFGMPIDLQFGMGFPRVGLVIAGQEVAFVHVGFTTGSRLTWGPLCKSGYVKLVVEGGYSLSVFGKTIASGDQVFAETEKRAGDC